MKTALCLLALAVLTIVLLLLGLRARTTIKPTSTELRALGIKISHNQGTAVVLSDEEVSEFLKHCKHAPYGLRGKIHRAPEHVSVATTHKDNIEIVYDLYVDEANNLYLGNQDDLMNDVYRFDGKVP
jgi:hypothetical protein